jgi:DNA-binding NarL/FixJ family response regulator
VLSAMKLTPPAPREAGGGPHRRPALVRALRLAFLEDEFVLFEMDLGRAPRTPRLPPVEAQVLELVLSGCSNGEIARARRRSPRTVANEVARLFRRFGVRSRLELFALVAGSQLFDEAPEAGRRSA